MTCAEQAISQVLWTEPTSAAGGADPAVEAVESVIAAALQEQIKLSNPSPNSFGMGHAVAIEGDTAVVGAPYLALNGIQRGRVFVYTRTSGSWQLEQILQRDVSVGFGESVDISGDTLIVGVKSLSQGLRDAVVFARTGTTWTQQATLQPPFGASGSVAIDGDTALVGSFDAVHVYQRAGSTWTQQAVLVPPDRAAGAASFSFGSSGPRSIALEGNSAIIGAERAPVGSNAEQGALYVFTRSGVVWTPQAKIVRSAGTAFARLGSDIALSGNTVIASGGSRGAYVFEGSGATWVERPALELPDSPPSCGVCPSVRTLVGGLAIDGNTAVVLGAPGEGGTVPPAAHTFKRVGTSWFLHEQLVASDAHLQNGVAIAGNTVIAGAPNFGSRFDDIFIVGPGAAYIFALSDTLPNQPPGAPTLTASASGSTVNLSWTPASGPSAVSFIVEAGSAPGLSNVFNGNVGSRTQLSAPAPPGSYYVRVRGVNAFGTGPASAEQVVVIGGAPGAPSVTSAAESGGILHVAWLAGPGSAATSHRLDFYSASTLVTSITVGAATAAAIAVPAGTRGTFDVRVTAFNGAAASPASAPFTFSLGAACTPPTSPSLSGGVVGGMASVTWTPVAGATSYLLSAGTIQGGTQYMAPTSMGTNTSASASGLPAGFMAWVRLVAVNACGQQSAPADFLVR